MSERPANDDLAAFIAGLPKAEIHVHHVGSASPRIVSELAARHPGKVPSDLDELREFYRFRDFAHFIEVYLAVVDLVREPEDVRLLTYEVAREMAAQQVRYAELTLTPYTSVMAGVPIEAFVEALLAELTLRADACDAAFGPSREPLRTVYLGGGTPTLLPPTSIGAILDLVRARFGIASDAEVTIEANPGPDERGSASALAASGVNRLSMGAQSFDPALLTRLGRRHRPRDVEDAVAEAQKPKARDMVSAFLKAQQARARLWVRINQLHDRLEATLKQCLRFAATEKQIPEAVDAAAHANLLLCFVVGRWHQFAKSGFKRDPMELWSQQWKQLIPR